MDTDMLVIQIRSLETQLAVLRTALQQADPKSKSFASFYGTLAEVMETTETDLAEAELKVKDAV